MATTTTAAAAIRNVFSPDVVLLTWLNEEWFAGHQKVSSMGDSSYRWTALRTTNAAGGTFVEGDPFPASGNLVFSQPSLSYGTGWANSFDVTDHLRAALAKPDAVVFPAIQLEAEQCLARLRDLMSATMIGTAGQGIQNAIDSTGTYAGLAKATVTNWAARETAVGGALTIAVFQNDIEALALPDLASAADSAAYRWYLPPEQITNLVNLMGSGAGTSLVRWTPGPGERVFTNVIDQMSNLKIGDAEVFRTRDLTNTVIMCAPKDDVIIVYHDEPDGRTSAGLKVEESARGGFVDKIVMSWKGVQVVKNPFHCAKDTGVTA